MQGRVLDELGISRQTYNRALKELEEAHLVSVDRNPGQTTVVTILDV
jgi:DNA-binding transcriptional regulator YhcF (GntR family)